VAARERQVLEDVTLADLAREAPRKRAALMTKNTVGAVTPANFP
jgi:hypothetical protein